MKFFIRKIICTIISAAVLLCLAPLCMAEPLDAALIPPEDLILMASRPVGHTAVYVGTFVTDTAMSFKNAGYDTVIQYDWSVDGDDNWHYTSDWDNYELSPMFDKIGRDTLFISEAFWLLYDEFYESFEAVTDTETGEDGSELRYIDFENHSVYMRARYIAIATDSAPLIPSG